MNLPWENSTQKEKSAVPIHLIPFKRYASTFYLLMEFRICNEEFIVSGFLLLIPFCIIRFLLPFILNKKAIQRAAHFAPVQGRERAAYYIYQLSNAGLLLCLLFLKVQPEYSWWFYTGLICYFFRTLPGRRHEKRIGNCSVRACLLPVF